MSDKPVILCVDDEKIILDSLEEQIEARLGDAYELELAQSAQEALEIIDEVIGEGRSLAVVISDQLMPGIKGDEFLADVHQNLPGTHKILLTGQASLESVQSAINRAGLYRYVTKPWEANDLMLTVSEAARSFLQSIQLDSFSQSNKLLRSLNEASQELSGEIDRHELYCKFLRNAVERIGADRAFLLIYQEGEPHLQGFQCKDPAEQTRMQAQREKHPDILAQRCLDKVNATLDGEDRPHGLAVPLRNRGQTIGYVYLENDQESNEFVDIQREILSMLISQLTISLDKAALYASLETKTRELQEEKEKVEAVNSLLEEKNADITDSINYARRIQESILPSHDELRHFFPDSFVLYRPKDIVSGDFYWWARRGEHFLLAAVDCTGHGVPGAFMSVIASNLLAEVARTPELGDAAGILTYLDQRMRNVLNQNTSGKNRHTTLDGMDIAFCLFDPANGSLDFAGAYNPLYLVRNGELLDYEGARASIGGDSEASVSPEYTSHRVQLRPGDAAYIFSDGLADQFGGERGRKFSKRRMRELLTEHASLPMAEQHYNYTKAFLNWKGDYEQLDDILLIGFRHP